MAETKYVNKNLFFIRFKTFQWHLNYKNYLEKRKNKPKSRTVAMNKKIFSFDGKIDSNPYPYTANNAYYSFNRNHIQKIKRMSWTHILGQKKNSPESRDGFIHVVGIEFTIFSKFLFVRPRRDDKMGKMKLLLLPLQSEMKWKKSNAHSSSFKYTETTAATLFTHHHRCAN